jgi:hypothetical protein
MDPPISTRQSPRVIDQHVLPLNIIPHNLLQHLPEPRVLHKRSPIPLNLLGRNRMEDLGRWAAPGDAGDGGQSREDDAAKGEVHLREQEQVLFRGEAKGLNKVGRGRGRGSRREGAVEGQGQAWETS